MRSSVRESVLVGFGRWLADRIVQAATYSRAHDLVVRFADVASQTFETSRLLRVIHAVVVWIRASWIFRWLTAEPDPTVVIIDLRETWTVGPILWIFDRIGRLVSAARASSSLYQWWTTLEQPLPVIIRESSTIDLLETILEPPEVESEHRATHDRSGDSQLDEASEPTDERDDDERAYSG